MTISKANTRSGDAEPHSSKLRSDSTIRPEKFGNHPVFRRDYICPTIQLEELAARVGAWINAGVQEGVIFGRPGNGKTLGIRYVSQHLSQRFPGFGCVQIHAGLIPRSPRKITRSFLEEHILEPIERTGRRSAVLWIDGAQLLDSAAVGTLSRLQEEIKVSGIRLLTVFVGDQRLRLITQTRVSLGPHVPTFVPTEQTEELELHGLRSIAEIEHCLKAFDRDCFPSDSGWCYTRFFLPQAYLNGFRLAVHARALWQVFVEEDQRNLPDTMTQVPMRCFARTVEQALIDGAALDHADFTIDLGLWKRAVLQSGWRDDQLLQLAAREMHEANALR